MSSEQTIDSKLFNIPKVVVLNLEIEPPNSENNYLEHLCQLPKVCLEKLNLEMNQSDTPSRKTLVPKVSLEKLNLDSFVEQKDAKINYHTPVNTSKSRTKATEVSSLQVFTKVPIVLLERCDRPKSPKKRVSFNIPQVSQQKQVSRVPQIFTYNLIGPHKNVPLKGCYVRIARDNLDKLAAYKPEKPSFCKLCGKVYFSKKKLLYHQERKHDLVTPTVQKKKRVSFSDKVIVHTMPYHRCRKCLKIFETYNILKTHMRSQHRKRDKYICDYCEKLFADRTIFKIHIKLHCEVCKELFNDKKELISHKKTVCGVRKRRKFKCNDCDDIYSSSLHLKDHSYTHQNKKFICDLCKEHFITKCNMIRHARLHDNDEESSCKYTSVRKGSLKVFTCQFCCESFIDEKDIGEHLEMYDGTENNCGYCGMRFYDETELLKHMWNHVNSSMTIVTDVAEINNDNMEINNENTIKNKVETLSNAVSSSRNGSTNDQLNNVKSQRENGNCETNGLLRSLLSAEQKPVKQKKMHYCTICNKGLMTPYSLRRHYRVHEKRQALPTNRCVDCEETFAWPGLLRAHTCLRSNYVDSIEVPIVNSIQIPINSDVHMPFQLEEDLPITNDVTTHIDFDIPNPALNLPSTVDRLPGISNSVAANKIYRYKVIRQEVPIEF